MDPTYRKWKKNAAQLYDFLLTSHLLWPSMTVQWFPDCEMKSSSQTLQRLLLGTRTNHQMDECLRIAHVPLPNRNLADPSFFELKPDSSALSLDGLPGPRTGPLANIANWNDSTQEIGGYTASGNLAVRVVQRIYHSGEVNKARYMPQNPDILATRSSNGDVYIYDRTKHPLQPPSIGTPQGPDVALLTKAHGNRTYVDIDAEDNVAPDSSMDASGSASADQGESFALSWSPFLEGRLISAVSSSPGQIALWDLNKFSKSDSSRVLYSESVFGGHGTRGHASIVNDLEWHCHNPHLFGSVADDGYCCLYDIRAGGNTPNGNDYVTSRIEVSPSREATSLAFNWGNANVLATADSAGLVSIWDLRNTGTRLMDLKKHKEPVIALEWSPHFPTVLASGSTDKTVVVWDIAGSRAGTSPPDSEKSATNGGAGDQIEVDDDSSGGTNQNREDTTTADQTADSLLFVHAGHSSEISDIAWNPAVPWMIASVAENNELHIWRPADTLVGETRSDSLLKQRTIE